MAFMKIGVYGLGRFGSFWAGCLAQNHEIKGYSRQGGKLLPKGVVRVEKAEILNCDTLFLCVSISSLEEVLKEIGPDLRPGTLVIDTCSVKVYPVKLMQDFLAPEIEIMATHPMFGPDSAQNGLVGRHLVYHLLRVSSRKARFWRQAFSDLGLVLHSIAPDEHDKEAAYTQGVTHFVGRVLQQMALKPSPIATQGYQKLLEIVEHTCNDPMRLFFDLQNYNPYTKEMRQKLAVSLEKVMRQI